jgi:hypothetical protein
MSQVGKPLDLRDYLIRQHEQERIRQQLDALFSKSDEDHAADQADRVSQQAYEAAEACAGCANDIEEALVDLVRQARDLRKISNGLVSPDLAQFSVQRLRS